MDESVEVDDAFTINFEEKTVKVEQDCLLDAAKVSRNQDEIIQLKCLEIDKTKDKLREISKEKSDLETKCESLIKHVQDLEEDKALMIEHNLTQAKDLQLSKTKLKSVQDLNQEYEEMVQEHEKVVERYQLQNQSLNTNLIQERVKLDKLKSEYQVKIESLQIELENSSKTTESVTQEKDKLKNECMKHNEKVEELIEERVRLDVLNTESQSKIERLQNQLEVSHNIIKTQTQEMDKFRTEAQVKIENLQKQLEITFKKAESINEVTRNYSAIIHELTQEKDRLKSEVQTNNEITAELIKERVGMEAFKIEAQSKIEWLQKQLEAKSDLFNKVAQERDKLQTESVTNNEKAAELIKLVEERLRMDALRTESQSKIDYLQNQLEVKSNLITEVTQERDKFKSECLTNNEKAAELIEERVRQEAFKIGNVQLCFI